MDVIFLVLGVKVRFSEVCHFSDLLNSVLSVLLRIWKGQFDEVTGKKIGQSLNRFSAVRSILIPCSIGVRIRMIKGLSLYLCRSTENMVMRSIGSGLKNGSLVLSMGLILIGGFVRL